MKSSFIILDKHQEMTKFVNFSTIKGMTETQNFKKVMVGRQNVYINLERAAVLLTLRTTDLH